MRLGYIVTEFPKITETFILRDLVVFDRKGHDVRILHLTPARRGEVIHEFAEHLLAKARSRPFLFSTAVLGALFRAALRHPAKLARVTGRIAADCLGDPATMLKSWAILPKSLAFAEDLERWGAHHVHAGFAGHPATAAWIISRFTGIPYSVSCHAHDIFVTQALLGPKLREASFVRAISAFNRDFLLHRFPDLDRERIEIIHCGADTHGIGIVDGMADEPFVVLYVGSLEVRKGVDNLLRALAQAEFQGDWRCEVVGGGPAAGSLQALARSLAISERVRFLGPLPSEEVAKAYGRASVVVVPSVVGPGGRTEGIPTVIMEALAHARPVIASELTGVPELIEDGVTGLLVPPGDVAALGGALRRVRGDPACALEMARAGRARVEAEFDATANAEAQLAQFQRHAVTQGGQTA